MLLLFAFLAAYARRSYAAGALLFSAALSVKMNALLFAPALALLTHLQVTPPTALSGAETRALRKLLRGDAGFVYPTLRSGA